MTYQLVAPSPIMRIIVAAAVIAGTLGCMAALIFHPNINPMAKDPLLILIGALSTQLANIGNWYFGGVEPPSQQDNPESEQDNQESEKEE